MAVGDQTKNISKKLQDLQGIFPEAIEFIDLKDSYQVSELEKVADGLLKAHDTGMVFRVDRGPELQSHKTPEEIICAISDGIMPSSSVHKHKGYQLVSIATAIKAEQENSKYFLENVGTVTPSLREHQARVLEQSIENTVERIEVLEAYDAGLSMKETAALREHGVDIDHAIDAIEDGLDLGQAIEIHHASIEPENQQALIQS